MLLTVLPSLFLLPALSCPSQLFLGPGQGLLSLPSFQSSPCPLPPHPVGSGLNTAVAVVFSSHLLVCGGWDGNWHILASCHALVEGQWQVTHWPCSSLACAPHPLSQERAPLSVERGQGAVSLTARGEVLVTGGQDDWLTVLDR